MDHFHISSILITKSSIRSAKYIDESHIRLSFYHYFGGDFIESIEMSTQDPCDGFPIHVEFRHVEIDTDLNKYNIDKIYEFNKILQEQTIVKMYVGENEIWTLCCLEMKEEPDTSKYSHQQRRRRLNDVHLIKSIEDSKRLLRDKMREYTEHAFMPSEIESKVNLLNTFMHISQQKSKYEIAEMMGGILDEDDHFVHQNKQTLDQYKNYITRKYRLSHLTPLIIDEIIEKTKSLYEKTYNQNQHQKHHPDAPIKLKRQCTEPETFERVHGISFEDADCILRDK